MQTFNMIREREVAEFNALVEEGTLDAADVTCKCWAGEASGKACLMDRNLRDATQLRKAFIKLFNDNEREQCWCPFGDFVALEKFYYHGEYSKRHK